MMTATEENYLKALFSLKNKQGEVSANELSRALGIRMSSVNSMMKKFSDKGFVNYESYKPITLTEKGKIKASSVIRKHRLTEMFLVEIMGLGWEEVHSIAEQIEHIQSITFFDRMDKLLNYPDIDPHGSPIPNKEGKLPVLNHVKLSECKVGETVTFASISKSSDDLLQFLSRKDLSLGTKLKIEAIENYDGSMIISRESVVNEVLSKVVCDKLLVSRE